MITFKGQNLKYLSLQIWHNFSILALALRTAELLTASSYRSIFSAEKKFNRIIWSPRGYLDYNSYITIIVKL